MLFIIQGNETRLHYARIEGKAKEPQPIMNNVNNWWH